MRLARLLLSVSLAAALGCDDDPTSVVVDNDYPVSPDAAAGEMTAYTETTVYKAWWGTSLLPDPVAPGGEGQPERTVPYSDYAYAVLAPGWDPQSSTAPPTFVAVRSAMPLSAPRGSTLHIHVSNGTFIGDCSANEPLTQDEATFIAQSIFPDEFNAPGLAYDAATCTMKPAAGDSESDADIALEGSVE
jgi:hypothetical protein